MNRWADAKTTPSGLRYVVTQEGDKKKSPKQGQKVTVHYTGTLLNGKMFDSSVQRGVPAQFAIGDVIEGWDEALKTMSKGEKRTLIIPPDSYLVFGVELISY